MKNAEGRNPGIGVTNFVPLSRSSTESFLIDLTQRREIRLPTPPNPHPQQSGGGCPSAIKLGGWGRARNFKTR